MIRRVRRSRRWERWRSRSHIDGRDWRMHHDGVLGRLGWDGKGKVGCDEASTDFHELVRIYPFDSHPRLQFSLEHCAHQDPALTPQLLSATKIMLLRSACYRMSPLHSSHRLDLLPWPDDSLLTIGCYEPILPSCFFLSAPLPHISTTTQAQQSTLQQPHPSHPAH
jgi:hypothetical protein